MRRIWRWEGWVEVVEDDYLGLRLTPVDHRGSEIYAEFDRSWLPNAIEGRYITLYLHRKGKKRRLVLREKRLPPWTQDQLDAIQAAATIKAALLAELIE